MNIEDELRFEDVYIQHLYDEHFENSRIHVDVLRLDRLHPIVSGNKWFKLKYHLQEAKERNCDSIATFGGAFSNHIVATAYVSNKQNVNCIGYIRGEKPKHLS